VVSYSVCHCQSLLPQIIFVDTGQRLKLPLSVAPIGLQSKGRLLALPANIKQGWKGRDNGKHASLLQHDNNYGRKKFYSICLRVLLWFLVGSRLHNLRRVKAHLHERFRSAYSQCVFAIISLPCSLGMFRTLLRFQQPRQFDKTRKSPENALLNRSYKGILRNDLNHHNFAIFPML